MRASQPERLERERGIPVPVCDTTAIVFGVKSDVGESTAEGEVRSAGGVEVGELTSDSTAVAVHGLNGQLGHLVPAEDCTYQVPG